MPDLASITLPDNNTYNFKDSVARASIPYGEVDSTSTATAFTATVSGITSLFDGVCVMLRNGVVTSAANFTININNLGAKPVYSNMATGNPITPTNPTRESTIFNINYTLMFVYSEDLVSGGCWINYRGYNSDTNTIGYQLRTNSTVMKTADQSRYYRMFFTSADGTHWIPANTAKDNSATSKKTVNQRPINPFGRIIYFSYTTNLSAESDVPAAYCWSQYALSLGYSFNRTGAALTLTTKTPVYLKCAPQSDGSAIIDSTTPYVQALPNAADGKIYIFLGIAYSATNIELIPQHPVYYHDGTAIRIWIGGAIPAAIQPATVPPNMDGTAAVGSSVKYAREDHVHPSDTTKVDKEALDDAGITGVTYTTMFGGAFTVETAVDADHAHPWARSNVTGRLDKRYKYRVTFNGEEYILPSQLLTFATNNGAGVKVCEYLGDISLYHTSQDGTLNDTYSVGFLIVSDEDNAGSIDIYTDVARDVVLIVERIEPDVNIIGSELIYGDAYKPFRTNHVSSTYEMFSVGANKMMETSKGGSAFGYNNSIDGNAGFAAGYNNSVTGMTGCAIGFGNLADQHAHAEGFRTTASNQNSHSEGYITTASGHTSHAEGTNTIASGALSHAEGDGCQALALGAHVQGGGTKANASQVYAHIFGVNNALTDETGKTVTIQRYNVDGTPFSNPKTRTLGKYAEVVGNGSSDSARSNARTLDWNGNESLAGGLTLGMGTANQTSITAQQLNALLALAASVPNAASIDANGLITFKNGNTSLFTLQLPIYDGAHHSASNEG